MDASAARQARAAIDAQFRAAARRLAGQYGADDLSQDIWEGIEGEYGPYGVCTSIETRELCITSIRGKLVPFGEKLKQMAQARLKSERQRAARQYRYEAQDSEDGKVPVCKEGDEEDGELVRVSRTRGPAAELEARDTYKAIYDGLPARCRLIFRMVTTGGQRKHKEIARVLGVSESTVDARFTEIRRFIRAAGFERGVLRDCLDVGFPETGRRSGDMLPKSTAVYRDGLKLPPARWPWRGSLDGIGVTQKDVRDILDGEKIEHLRARISRRAFRSL